jgi:hypothetical protein
MKTTLYCCKCKYPDIAASLGSALGYQGYVEIIAAALVMALYISIYRKGGSNQPRKCIMHNKPGADMRVNERGDQLRLD